MHKQLAEGGTVVLIPGGVQECSFMEPGKEVAFLRSRKGFVRIALQHGEQLRPFVFLYIQPLALVCRVQSDRIEFVSISALCWWYLPAELLG